jgi:hypothetical protein
VYEDEYTESSPVQAQSSVNAALYLTAGRYYKMVPITVEIYFEREDL